MNSGKSSEQVRQVPAEYKRQVEQFMRAMLASREPLAGYECEEVYKYAMAGMPVSKCAADLVAERMQA